MHRNDLQSERLAVEIVLSTRPAFTSAHATRRLGTESTSVSTFDGIAGSPNPPSELSLLSYDVQKGATVREPEHSRGLRWLEGAATDTSNKVPLQRKSFLPCPSQ